MATIAALVVEMGVNTAAFKADLAKARAAVASNASKINRALASIQRGFGKVIRRMGRFAKRAVSMRGAIGLLVGGGGLGLLIRTGINAADSIGKTADAIGISTGALQEYRFALDISGVAQEKTDKGLKKFVRNMGELARSSSETQTALKDIDPALLSNLRNLDSVEDQLQASFRALGAYDSQTRRAAVAQALFGRSGVDMTVGVKDGSASLEALREEARRLGFVLSDRMVRSAEKAKDALTKMGKVIKVNVTRLAVAAAPSIIRLGAAFAAAAPKIARFFGTLLPASLAGPEELSRRLLNLRLELEELQASQAGRAKDFLLLDSDSGGLRMGVVEEQIAALEALREAAEKSETAAKRALEAETAGAKTDQVKAFTESLDNQIVALDNRLLTLGRTEGAIARVNAQQSLQELLKREDIKLTGEQSAKIGAFVGDLERSTDRLREAEDAQRDLTGEVRSFGQAASTALQDVVTDLDNANDAARSLIRTLQNAIFKRTVGKGINSLLDAVFKIGAGALAGGAGGTSSLAFAAPGGIAPLAHGGTARAGAPHLVGERGPELFVPGRTGTVVSNDNLAGLGRAVTINQTFDFSGASPGVFAEGRRFMDQVVAETKAAVFADIERGGSAAKAVGRRAA